MECKHDWKQEYYGLRCTKCNLFYPDTGNWFVDDDEEEVYDYDRDIVIDGNDGYGSIE